MIYIVGLRYIGGDLMDLTRGIRKWLDHNRVEPKEFLHSSGPAGLAFRMGFRNEDHAAAFAKAFGGWVECSAPQGLGARWTRPLPSLHGMADKSVR
jgi:hypothetical protein